MPVKNGETEKQVIFLRNQSDLERLKTAILMKKIISLNAADHILKLRNFTRGRLLRMPTIREEDVELIDADVAILVSIIQNSTILHLGISPKDFIAFRKALSGSGYEQLLQ